jgi:propanol-preferring alcohol dehydrogenase
MKAMVLPRPAPVAGEPLEPRDLPLPVPGPGQVRLRVRACGVCRTDLHIVEGELPPHRLPVVPGHQVVGVVDELGPGVSGPPPGTRVGVAWLHAACGVCEHCRQGRENLCPRARFTGYDVDGGYAEAVLAPADFVLPLPEGLADDAAAPLLCAGIIGYRALRLAEVRPGDRVGLFGFGASAHLALQVARHWGCEVHVFTRGAAHRALAAQLGAAWTGAAEESPPAPLDAAVTFAPTGAVIPHALRHLRPGGTLAVNAVHLDGLPAMDWSLLYGERTLRSVTNATRRDGEEFLRLAAAIPVRPHVVRYPLAAANQALRDLKGGRIDGAAVLCP